MIRKWLRKLTRTKAKPAINDCYLLWIKNGFEQANQDESWRLEK